LSPLVLPPSWARSFEKFHCRECGGHEAYRSRPRGVFEKWVLPVLMLRPVRCDQCFHRSYVFRGVPALEHLGPVSKPLQNRPPGGSDAGTRVA
jgi:hypothetical protein